MSSSQLKKSYFSEGFETTNQCWVIIMVDYTTQYAYTHRILRSSLFLEVVAFHVFQEQGSRDPEKEGRDVDGGCTLVIQT